MTSGGHKVDNGGRRGPHSNTWNNTLDFIIECFVARQDPRCLQDHEYSAGPVRSPLSGLLHMYLQSDTAPLHPPCVHLTSFTSPFIFYSSFPSVYIPNANGRTKREARKWGYQCVMITQWHNKVKQEWLTSWFRFENFQLRPMFSFSRSVLLYDIRVKHN